MKRTAKSHWQGSAKEGGGHLSTQSGVFDEQPYSFKLRFENEDGQQGTNPEELIGAAHAGCYNMALSVALSEADHAPESLDTAAEVYLESKDGGFAITRIVLDLRAKIPSIDEATFNELAEGAKANCPVSKALQGVEIELKKQLDH